MHKEIISLPITPHSGFSWVREPDFTPPGDDGGMNPCVTHEFAAPRIGELKTLLEIFLENTINTVKASAGVVRLLSPDGRTLQIISSAGLSNELQEDAEKFVGLSCTASEQAAQHNVVHATDISSCHSRQICQHANCQFQTLVSAPLESPNAPDTSLGILTLFFNAPLQVANQNLNIIAAFAEVMSATIEHTHFNREARRIELLAERHVIANDIHDSLAQTLTYARMRVSLLLEAIRVGDEIKALQYASDLDEALEIGQKSTRELVTDFRCEMNHGGLSAALQDLTLEFRKRHDIDIEYHNRLIDLELPLEHEIQVYHIVHEALNNIARHSGASHARLFVDGRFGYYIFTIEDNGSGACTFAPVEGHYGVMIMRERTHRIGGKIKVECAPGLGTQVQLFFPEPTLDWRATQ